MILQLDVLEVLCGFGVTTSAKKVVSASSSQSSISVLGWRPTNQRIRVITFNILVDGTHWLAEYVVL